MKKRGFTLIELLVATVIMALLNITIWQLLRGGIKTYRKSKIMAALQQNAGFAMDRISLDANAIYSIGTPQYAIPGDCSTLTFVRRAYVSPTSNTGYYTWYGVDSITNNLERGQSSSYAAAETAAIPIAEYCTNAVFSYNTNTNCIVAKLTFAYPGISESWGTLTVSSQSALRHDGYCTYGYQGYYNLACTNVFLNDLHTRNPLGNRYRLSCDF